MMAARRLGYEATDGASPPVAMAVASSSSSSSQRSPSLVLLPPVSAAAARAATPLFPAAPSLAGAATLRDDQLVELQRGYCKRSLDLRVIPRGWHDVWAAVALWATVVTVAVVAGLWGEPALAAALAAAGAAQGGGGSAHGGTTSGLVVVLVAIGVGLATTAVLACALALALLWLGGRLIKPAAVLYMAVLAGAAVWAWVAGGWVAGLLMTLLVLLMGIAVGVAWAAGLLDFAAALTNVAVAALGEYPGVWVVAAGGVFVEALWLLAVALATLGLDARTGFLTALGANLVPPPAGGSVSAAAAGGLAFALVVAAVWGTVVIGFVVQFVATAVAGHWALSTGQPDVVTHSLGRAMGPSFGSLSFGGFVYALVEGARLLVRAVRRGASRDGRTGCFTLCLLWCLECWLGLLGDLLERLNYLAVAVMALTGRSYCAAASHVKYMFGDGGTGWLALFNADWTRALLSAIALMTACIAAGVAAGTAYGTAPPGSRAGGLALVAGCITLAAAAAVLNVVVAVVAAASTGIFMCYADLPYDCAVNHPAEFKPLSAAFFKGFGAKLHAMDRGNAVAPAGRMSAV